MLTCPVCHRAFDDSKLTCPHDGAVLNSSTDPRVGTNVDKYHIMGPISSGGMGTVYRAEHILIGRQVAMKILRPEFRAHEQLVRRFLVEARAASMIRHPNIVDVFDFGATPEGDSYCVMEYIEGKNLADLLDEEGVLPLYRTVNILVQVCRALAACHDQGIVHRDLKPENIMLISRTGRRQLVTIPAEEDDDFRLEKESYYDHVKILDFGVAQVQKLTSSLDEQSREAGIVFGSPDYISPEQALGKPTDHRTDIYSLGVIFYEMLTGDIPFHGETAQEVMLHHVRTAPVPPSKRRTDIEIPREADELAMKALAKMPEHRIQSMSEFYLGLKRCVGRTVYRRDLRKALARYSDTIRRLPAPPSLGASGSQEQEQLREEIGRFFQEASKEPSRVDLEAVSFQQAPNEDELALDELRHLLREETEKL